MLEHIIQRITRRKMEFMRTSPSIDKMHVIIKSTLGIEYHNFVSKKEIYIYNDIAHLNDGHHFVFLVIDKTHADALKFLFDYDIAWLGYMRKMPPFAVSVMCSVLKSYALYQQMDSFRRVFLLQGHMQEVYAMDSLFLILDNRSLWDSCDTSLTKMWWQTIYYEATSGVLYGSPRATIKDVQELFMDIAHQASAEVITILIENHQDFCHDIDVLLVFMWMKAHPQQSSRKLNAIFNALLSHKERLSPSYVKWLYHFTSLHPSIRAHHKALHSYLGEKKARIWIVSGKYSFMDLESNEKAHEPMAWGNALRNLCIIPEKKEGCFTLSKAGHHLLEIIPLEIKGCMPQFVLRGWVQFDVVKEEYEHLNTIDDRDQEQLSKENKNIQVNACLDCFTHKDAFLTFKHPPEWENSKVSATYTFQISIDEHMITRETSI